MKVLYFAPELPIFMHKWQRVHFFDELARHNVEIDVFNPLYYKTAEEANLCLIKKLLNSSYSVFMTYVYDNSLLFLDSINKIKSYGIPTLFIRFDNLTIPYFDKDICSVFDLVWLTSKETQYLYDKWGAKTVFAPYAANPYVFKYTESHNYHKLCFIGNPYGSRSLMINRLSSCGCDVDIYHSKKKKSGTVPEDSHIVMDYNPPFNKYLFYKDRLKFKEGRCLIKGSVIDKLFTNHEIISNQHVVFHDSLSFDDMMLAYSQYALAVSFTSTEHTDVLKHPLGRTFLRTFEIPMCGGIQFCRYFKEVAEYFEDGKEIVFYHTNDELEDKAKYYTTKASDTELFSMKRAARKRSEKEHTWYHRFSKVFRELNINI
ncbi:MAG: glycosyltransferase family 1 protein [Clostridiaceae bacterium]|nr:glycosyltransferase family 1 protein [Clostridiaceae bacterium]